MRRGERLGEEGVAGLMDRLHYISAHILIFFLFQMVGEEAPRWGRF